MKVVLACALLAAIMESIKQMIKTVFNAPHMTDLLREWADEGLALQRKK